MRLAVSELLLLLLRLALAVRWLALGWSAEGAEGFGERGCGGCGTLPKVGGAGEREAPGWWLSGGWNGALSQPGREERRSRWRREVRRTELRRPGVPCGPSGP